MKKKVYTDKALIKNRISISLFILFILLICQISKVFTIPGRTYITNKFYPLLFLLIVCFIYFSSNYYDNYINKNSSIISDNFNNLSEIIDEKNEYIGKQLNFVGFIEKDYLHNKIYLVREKMTCCQYDSKEIKIPLIDIDNSVKEGYWIIVTGQLTNNSDLEIKVLNFKYCNEPSNRFLHD